MNLQKPLLFLSTLILICGCNTTTVDKDAYVNRKSSNDGGIQRNEIETLKIENDTFNYVKSVVEVYSTEAANVNNISGAYTLTTEANYSGSVAIEKSQGGADIYVLTYESYTYKWLVTGKGAEERKSQEKTILTNVFGGQEAIDLLSGKTITSNH